MFMDIFGIKKNDDTTRINDLTLILSFSLRSRPLKKAMGARSRLSELGLPVVIWVTCRSNRSQSKHIK